MYKSIGPSFQLVPNWVTLIKLCLTIGLIFLFPQAEGALISTLCFIIIAIDVLDGFIARTLDQTSDFGAIFDAESDALYVLVCAVGVYLFYEMPLWILFMGLIRYFYEIPIYFLKKKEKKQIEGRSIYAILAGIVFILIALSFLLGMYQFHALVLANIILAYSFSRGFYEDFIKI
tara:strand:+ start:5003 stop:5527 length:525 start_codon:yes stop_codon:yes gene_type:complete